MEQRPNLPRDGEIVGIRDGVYESDTRVVRMGKAVAKRRASSAKVNSKVDSSRRNRGQVLKFDRRAGLIMMERAEPATTVGSCVTLVRNLLSFLRLIPPARLSIRRAKAQRIR